MEIIIAFVLFILVWGYGGALVIRLICWGVPLLIDFLDETASIALRTLFKGIAILIVAVFRGACWLGRRAYLFLSILIDEWRNPGDEHAYEDGSGAHWDDEYQDDSDEEDFAMNPYPQAVDNLGLKPGFTREQFKRAYRSAMRSAHPDAGGSVEQAQQVNRAREVIMEAHGWS